MNAYDNLSNVERWNLIHFLQSRYNSQNNKPLSVIEKIISKSINSPISLQMDDSIWNEAFANSHKYNSCKGS